ncbi:MAG: family 16 glycosylhydrolase [Marinoscillum sp.]
MMKIAIYSKKMLFGVLLVLAFAASAQCPNVTWSDEFEGASLDLTKWNYQIGDGCAEGICGWGNGELQSYQQDNVIVENGLLKLTARKERVRGSSYTSGRVNSKGKGDFTYGRFEASIKLPLGDGLWPAFWMLPTDEVYGGWPQSGEIDIMEFTASDPDNIYGTLHYGDPYPNNQHQGNKVYLKDGIFPDAFHEFAIEWEPGEIRWYLDGVLFSTKTTADISPYNWPFDQDFHFLLNVAVGGSLGGPVDNSMLPSTMEVDYVRVFDGFRPSLSGDDVVSNQGTGAYQISNIDNSVSINWTVPSGATIVSGQGSSAITVDFGSTSGNVTATFDAGCGSESRTIAVEVELPYNYGFSFENFETSGSATFILSTGTLTEVSNPGMDAINGSAIVGEYQRNSTEQYDLLVYNTAAISDADSYVVKDNKFYMDVYTSAPVGTEVLIQLETSIATPSNYPSGRHSRFVAATETRNAWQRLEFRLLDRPDAAADPSDVSTIILLFNSNTLTSDIYYFDNFDNYMADNGGGSQNQSPSVSISNPSEGSTFTTGTSITISADASDPDGSVASVSFYANGALIGTDNQSPYSVEWIVVSGVSVLSAIATDNENASSTEASVSVTGQDQNGTASAILVSDIVTGSVSAGKGKKNATAQVTVVDDLGNPVSGASVSGTFSGTLNESVTATTNGSGIATLQTNGSAKGSLSVNVCVDDIVGSLPYDPTQNVLTCTSGSARLANAIDQSGNSTFTVYPNPVREVLYISYGNLGEASVRLYNMSGKLLESFGRVNKINMTGLKSGIYLIEISSGAQKQCLRVVK